MAVQLGELSGELVADTKQKSNETNWLLLKIPNAKAVPVGLRGFLTFAVMVVGIAAVSYFVALSVELGLAIFVEQNFEDARNIALILAALIGAPFIWWRVVIANRQADTGEENRRLAEESHHADLFTKAIEQLGADKDERAKDDEGEWQHRTVQNTEVRLGGIYALERLSLVSPAFHWSIMEVLTAYIRENSPVPEREETEESEIEFPRSEAIGVDIQAIVTVIGRRRRGDVERSLTLDQELDLRRVNLTRADLFSADLTEANLNEAYLIKARLIGAHLIGAKLIKASLIGAKLNDAKLIRAWLTQADLAQADLTEADLTEVSLIGAKLNDANLTEADLIGANLIKADLIGAKLNEATLAGANLIKAKLTGADLSEVNLTEANLIGANLGGANLNGAKLNEADLIGANLRGATLAGANLIKAKLAGADLTEADLRGARLFGTELVHPMVTGTKITQDQLESARGDQTTILPDGLSRPSRWPKA